MPAGSKPAPGEYTRVIGAILRSRMARLNISQTSVAKHIDVSLGQTSRMLRGGRHIDVDQLVAICEFLGLDIRNVFDEARAEITGDTPPSTQPVDLRTLQAEIRLARAIQDSGVTNIAARGAAELHPETIDAIAALLERDARQERGTERTAGSTPGIQ